MTTVDADSLARKAQMVGLLNEQQVQEAWEELGNRGGDAEPFLRLLERKGLLTPWQSHKLLKGDKTGYFLGGHKLLYKISSGSFGRVFRAEDKDSGRVVAIKVLRKRWSDNKHSVELFEREGQVGLTLKDPGIVEILGVHQDPPSKKYYIVMEFVEGGSLRDFLVSRKKLEPSEALRILEDVTSGLCYAASRGVTHRDIKPTNILISAQRAAKLVDFGLAKIYSHYSSQGQHDEKVDRTVDYAGLEEATGTQAGDVRSDIFFLGCVLYEMLTGRPPSAPTRDRHARMRRQRFENLPLMSRDEVAGPPSLFRLVETMTAFDPQQRHQTPSQLLEAIRAVRRDIEDKTDGGKSSTRTVFVVEKEERLQNQLREGFNKQGYRVLLAADPARALDRFQQQPFDALIVDAGSTGKEGQTAFERILYDAERQGLNCGGVLILSEEQAAWASEVKERPNTAVLVLPVTFKQLSRKLKETMASADTATVKAAGQPG